MSFLRCVAVLGLIYLLVGPGALAQDLEKDALETIEDNKDSDISWYAVIKLDDGKEKLYTKGDIFSSRLDLSECFRIADIKKDALLLKDTNSNEEFSLKVGDRVPLEEIELIFKRTVQANILKMR